MGDSRRFHTFAKLISTNFPDKEMRIADVAGGKGYLQASLRELGYKQIISFDRRKAFAKPVRQSMYRYQLFDCKQHSGEFDLTVGMHPDGGTDHIIEYGRLNKVPFIVCPCCAIASATNYWGSKSYHDWTEYLYNLSLKASKTVFRTVLPIGGRSLVIIGKTK